MNDTWVAARAVGAPTSAAALLATRRFPGRLATRLPDDVLRAEAREAQELVGAFRV